MKKITACLLSVVLLGLLSACDLRAASSSLPVSSAPPVSSMPESKPEPPVYPLPDGNTINPLSGLARPEGMAPGQRPVAVMVANSQAALPQRGITQAEVIFEMPIASGTTALMAVFADYRSLPAVGPVTAVQDSFIQFAIPGQYIVSHINNTVYGRNLLQLLSYKTVDGIVVGSSAFHFDEERNLPYPEGRPSEYCWFTDASLLWTGMEYIDIAPTGEVPALFIFGDAPPSSGAEARMVTFTYNPSSVVTFQYDEASGLYFKNIFGQPHMQEDGTQLNFTNLIALETPTSYKPDKVNPEFNLASGQGYYFTRGKMQLISWEKGGPADALKLFDEAGAPLQVQRGKSYIGVVPKIGEAESAVSFEAAAPAVSSVPESIEPAESVTASVPVAESVSAEQPSVPEQIG